MNLLSAIAELAKLPEQFAELSIKVDMATGDVAVTCTPADLVTGEMQEPLSVTVSKADLMAALDMEDAPAEGGE